ncbi:cleavage stimulation factor, 3' pre-RNA, subunit 1, partial [Irineochytrium annulatum]
MDEPDGKESQGLDVDMDALHAAYSTDGRYIATGSSDHSLKVIDVQKIRDQHLNSNNDPADKPVIRTLYDHTAAVNDVAFHPNGTVLASA